MTAIGCTCDETLIEEVRKNERGAIEFTGRVYRKVPEGHDCYYVQERSKLIPGASAWAFERARSDDEYTRLFHERMEQMVKSLRAKGEL